MKAEAANPGKARPIVVWESRPQQQTGNVVSLPARSGRGGVAEQEASVKTWTVGPAERSAVVTEVSSGFASKRTTVASPQAIRMSSAA